MSDKKSKRTEDQSETENIYNRSIKKLKSCAGDHTYEDLLESPLGKLIKNTGTKIFQYLSFHDLGRLCLASKSFGNLVFEEMTTEHFLKRITNSLLESRSDGTLKLQCHRTALLAKRSSWLMPVNIRMRFFYQLLHQIKVNLGSHSPSLPLTFILDCCGMILHQYILGWEDIECRKIYSYLCGRLGITASMFLFKSNVFGWNTSNENFLRVHLRHLFLDHCENQLDQALWLSYITDYSNELAQVIMLLYSPMNESEGKVDWDFITLERSSQIHIESYVSLSKIISLLKLMPNWTPNYSLEVLIYVSNTPNCWLLRSFASLLLPLISSDLDLVLRYFHILYNSDRTNVASLLISLIMTVSPYFIATASQNGEMEITISNVKTLIRSIIDSPCLSNKRSLVTVALWDTNKQIAKDFADAARAHNADYEVDARNEYLQDFHHLLSAWKNISRLLMKEHSSFRKAK